MKVLLINGSPHKEGCTYTALSEVAKQLNKHGIETEIFHIGAKPFVGCLACKACRKEEQAGHCVYGDEDGVNRCIDLINAADGVVVGSPVYYSGAAGQCTAFLDRVFYAKKSFKFKLGAAVVSCRRSGATATFERLNQYFTISSMPVVPSQYWNNVHGNTPQEVMQDIEGLQTMRTLADNMAWMLQCIEAGKKAGIEPPVHEAQTPTNFIR